MKGTQQHDLETPCF